MVKINAVFYVIFKPPATVEKWLNIDYFIILFTHSSKDHETMKDTVSEVLSSISTSYQCKAGILQLHSQMNYPTNNCHQQDNLLRKQLGSNLIILRIFTLLIKSINMKSQQLRYNMLGMVLPKISCKLGSVKKKFGLFLNIAFLPV